VTAALTGLQPGSVYHCRLVAVNAVGTTNGTDETFTTSSVAAQLRIARITSIPGHDCAAQLRRARTASLKSSRCSASAQVRFTGTINPGANGQRLTIRLTARIGKHSRVVVAGGKVHAGRFEVVVTLSNLEPDAHPDSLRDAGDDRCSYVVGYTGGRSVQSARVTGAFTLATYPA
jgi:hypothetical protein